MQAEKHIKAAIDQGLLQFKTTEMNGVKGEENLVGHILRLYNFTVSAVTAYMT